MITGTPSAWACHVDDPSVISVEGGALHLGLRRLEAPAYCPVAGTSSPYIAGMISTFRKFSQRYGRFEARYKSTAAAVPGLHEAFWLWRDDRDPVPAGAGGDTGEIDIVETFSRYPDLAIPYLHYTADASGGPVPGKNTSHECTVRRGEFNTYTLEWDESRMVISVNGETCLVNTDSHPAFNQRYIVAFTQAMGGVHNGYDGRAPLPATMTVDYVKVWE